MDKLTINKKKYILLPIKEYNILQKRAALKAKPDEMLSIKAARAYSKDLIQAWASEK